MNFLDYESKEGIKEGRISVGETHGTFWAKVSPFPYLMPGVFCCLRSFSLLFFSFREDSCRLGLKPAPDESQ
jgi:hypothetical protein